MRLEVVPLPLEDRLETLKSLVRQGDRLGLITSIDGSQLISLVLSPSTGLISCFSTVVEGTQYPSITTQVPQAHWFERILFDMFGLEPSGHPRLKTTHLHDCYVELPAPLAGDRFRSASSRTHEFLSVQGDSVYELPVGPIHAGIIEPGHFRFSCYGEQIVNLEIQLGWVHRGVEKRLTEVPWQKATYVAEAAATDMPVANALAHATAIESLFDLQLPYVHMAPRTVALEVERVAMHLSDLIGFAGDIGFLAISSSISRLRGNALRMAELISGNRFMHGFVLPGGTLKPISIQSSYEIRQLVRKLRNEFKTVVDLFFDNQSAIDRMHGVGRVASSLANDFGLVGVAGRAGGSDYDCRRYWRAATFPNEKLIVAKDSAGDVLARARVRVSEILTSLDEIEFLLKDVCGSATREKLPNELPQDAVTVGIVESHRGELIHLIFTDNKGRIQRYAIKDPSVNNWTALAIAVRNNVVADFPLCNKSFSLSYSGHDL